MLMLFTKRFLHLRMVMHKFIRFAYLNTYSFLLLICGAIPAVIPLYRISMLLLLLQISGSLLLFYSSVKLFSTWRDKKIKYEVLLAKNRNGFRQESFKVFMQAPCGRLLTKAVLADLGLKDKYRELLAYKEPFFDSVKNGFKTTRTRIYMNEAYR